MQASIFGACQWWRVKVHGCHRRKTRSQQLLRWPTVTAWMADHGWKADLNLKLQLSNSQPEIHCRLKMLHKWSTQPQMRAFLFSLVFGVSWLQRIETICLFSPSEIMLLTYLSTGAVRVRSRCRGHHVLETAGADAAAQWLLQFSSEFSSETLNGQICGFLCGF